MSRGTSCSAVPGGSKRSGRRSDDNQAHAMARLGSPACLPAALGADTYPRQTGIDAVHYVFRLALGDASDEITGEATITVKFLVDKRRRRATRSRVAVGRQRHDGASVRRGGVTETPGPASDAHRVHARQQPPAARAAGAHRRPARNSPSRSAIAASPPRACCIGNNIHGDRTFFGENWPNQVRHWLPMIDHPYDKATGEFIVTAPQSLSGGGERAADRRDRSARATCAARTGSSRCRSRRGSTRSAWRDSRAPCRHRRRRAAADVGVPAGSRGRASRLFEDLSRRAMDFFVAHIGPYPYEKLANVQATGFSGGTEYASAIFYGEKGVTAGRGPVVHEIAHQWWGNSVTERDWDDVWLSEGFATYFTLLFTEHDEGRDAFVDGLKRSRAQVLQLEQKLPDTPVIHRNLSDMSKVLNNLVYQKGGWVLHMLRAGGRHRTFLDGDSRLLPPLSRSERVDRGAARGVRAGVGEAARLVLRAVAESSRRAEDRRLVALPAGAQGHRSDADANAGRGSVPARGGRRHCRQGRRRASRRTASSSPGARRRRCSPSTASPPR